MKIKTKQTHPALVFKILPAYQKVSKKRKLNALGLLLKWIAVEIEKVNKQL